MKKQSKVPGYMFKTLVCRLRSFSGADEDRHPAAIPPPASRLPPFKGWLWPVSTVLAICAAVSWGLAWLLLFSSFPGMPPFERVRQSCIRSDAVLLDRNGEVIHELRIDRSGRRLEWVALKDISPALVSAVLAAEDKRFFRHRGVDWLAVAGSLLGFLHTPDPRGASTITMQLASQLDRELRPRNIRRSIWQKSRQVRAAHTLERRWSKQQILEAYLNLVTYRGELQGISAASLGLFGKKPHGLDIVESVLLAALVRSPNAAGDAVAMRARMLAEATDLILPNLTIETRARDTLSRPYFVPPQATLAPHVARQLISSPDKSGGFESRSVRCALDGRLQAFAIRTLQYHLAGLKSQNMHDGAILIAENRSGDILAYVGNAGDEASARYVDGIQAMRQAGSTLKPFIYGLAFDHRMLTAASLLEDSPLDVPVAGGLYQPRNYDRMFHGLVTARVALASSLNVPAVRVLNLVGVDSAINQLRLFGFRNLRNAEFYGPSLALGAVDITLWDLTNAYRALANGGIFGRMRLAFESAVEPSTRVLSAEAAYLLSDILSDRESRSMTFNLDSPLATRFWSSVKTGTSKDMRDNWCVGYSGRYTVGVWTGNFSGEPMWNVSGVTGAAPVWVEIMNHLHRSESSAAPAPPSRIIQQSVEIATQGEKREEYFIRGTESGFIREAAISSDSKIICPASGAVITLDPDIPEGQQRVFFEAQPRGNHLSWVLDGRIIGTSESIFLWPPKPGKHILALTDGADRVLDSVSFEIRGNPNPMEHFE